MKNTAIFAILAAVFASAASAGERIELKPKDPVTILPNKAYVLIGLGASAPMQLVRRASADERATWEAKRAVEMTKAVKRYQKRAASYPADLKDWNEMSVSDRMRFEKPEKPEYVDAQTFYMNPPELSHFVNVLGRKAFSTPDGREMVLLQLEPGDYDVYSLSDGKDGGRCLCMGSIGFTAVSGKVVSVGSFRPVDGEVHEFKFVPATPGEAVPAAVASDRVEPAPLHAVGAMPNIFGSRLARIAPVDGLLTYELGTPVGAGGRPADAFK